MQPQDHPQTRLSGIIICRNESERIGRCIQSLKQVADEIIIIDTGSTDNTVEVARQFGASTFTMVTSDFSEMRNYGLEQARFDLVFYVDADEILSEQLIKSIRAVKASASSQHMAWSMNRRNFFKRSWIRSNGWYPDAKVRMWVKGTATWKGHIHEQPAFAGKPPIVHLNGDLLHFSFSTIKQLADKANAYSTIYANGASPSKKVTVTKLLFKTLASFFRSYLLKGGVKDGFNGLVISFSNAAGTFYKYAKVIERFNNPTVSLVITTYNRPDALRSVLLSAFEQSRLPDEIVIADDGSTEETANMLKEIKAFSPVPIIHAWHEDSGFRAAAIRNKAVAMASGDYIVLIDGDIYLHKRFIEDHIQCARPRQIIQGSRALLDDNATAALISGKLKKIGFFSPGLSNRKNVVHSRFLSKLLSGYSTNLFRVRSANMSFWRSDYIAVNGFNEAFVGWGREDSEFMSRMQNAGNKRLQLKFRGLGFHLEHPHNDRNRLPVNDQILTESTASGASRCDKGIDAHLKAVEHNQ